MVEAPQPMISFGQDRLRSVSGSPRLVQVSISLADAVLTEHSVFANSCYTWTVIFSISHETQAIAPQPKPK